MASPAHLETMHRLHAVDPQGRTCATCVHCVSVPHSHPSRGTIVRSTCRKMPTRTNARGDVFKVQWLRRWAACGLFRDGDA